jgi:chemotaxis protein methyltransferase CheR
MRPDDYQFLSHVLARGSGLALGDGKEYLIESRLTPVAASMGLTDVDGLVSRLRTSPDPETLRTLCEAMTTNESLFFRDGAPFEMLKRTVFPALQQSRQPARKIRIWSAAASTGQEAYSIAMTRTLDAPALADWTVEIVGTDLSRTALARARRGIFNQFEVQRGLPIALLMKCFTQVPEGWQVNENIRKQVTFREFNLLDDFGGLGLFDVIFCRNVLIYFDQPTKTAVLGRLARALAADGYLFLGGAETVLGLTDAFVRIEGEKTSVYRRR